MIPESKVCPFSCEGCSDTDSVLEYVTQYASNVHQDDDEDDQESDGELSEVDDYKSDDDEPAGKLEDV